MTSISRSPVPFLTPIHSINYPIIQVVDDYLWFGGKVAEVIESKQLEAGSIPTREGHGQISMLHTVLKIATMVLSLGILPLLALALKAIIRSNYHFHFVTPSMNTHVAHRPDTTQAVLAKSQPGALVSPNDATQGLPGVAHRQTPTLFAPARSQQGASVRPNDVLQAPQGALNREDTSPAAIAKRKQEAADRELALNLAREEGNLYNPGGQANALGVQQGLAPTVVQPVALDLENPLNIIRDALLLGETLGVENVQEVEELLENARLTSDVPRSLSLNTHLTFIHALEQITKDKIIAVFAQLRTNGIEQDSLLLDVIDAKDLMNHYSDPTVPDNTKFTQLSLPNFDFIHKLQKRLILETNKALALLGEIDRSNLQEVYASAAKVDAANKLKAATDAKAAAEAQADAEARASAEAEAAAAAESPAAKAAAADAALAEAEAKAATAEAELNNAKAAGILPPRLGHYERAARQAKAAVTAASQQVVAARAQAAPNPAGIAVVAVAAKPAANLPLSVDGVTHDPSPSRVEAKKLGADIAAARLMTPEQREKLAQERRAKKLAKEKEA